jgi:hypothetical protein
MTVAIGAAGQFFLKVGPLKIVKVNASSFIRVHPNESKNTRM